MSMILGDINFSVREATIYGSIAGSKGVPPGLSWYVEVQSETQPVKVPMADDNSIDEEIAAKLRLSCEFESARMRRWLELEGQTVHSTTAESSQFPAVFSYFETHERIPRSTLKLGKRTGNKFRIHWGGICHPMFGEPYDRDVPFLIQTEAVFKEINIRLSRSDTEATSLLRLSEFLAPSDFIQLPIEETVRELPFAYSKNFIEKKLRRLFNCPLRIFTRSAKFEPRI